MEETNRWENNAEKENSDINEHKGMRDGGEGFADRRESGFGEFIGAIVRFPELRVRS